MHKQCAEWNATNRLSFDREIEDLIIEIIIEIIIGIIIGIISMNHQTSKGQCLGGSSEIINMIIIIIVKGAGPSASSWQ